MSRAVVAALLIAYVAWLVVVVTFAPGRWREAAAPLLYGLLPAMMAFPTAGIVAYIEYVNRVVAAAPLLPGVAIMPPV